MLGIVRKVMDWICPIIFTAYCFLANLGVSIYYFQVDNAYAFVSENYVYLWFLATSVMSLREREGGQFASGHPDVIRPQHFQDVRNLLPSKDGGLHRSTN